MNYLISFTLSFACLLAHAQTFHNMQGYRYSENAWQPFNWMKVHDGRITEIGSGKVKLSENEPAIDMEGAFVLPGLMDAHGHVLSYGQEQRQVDLRGSKSVQEVISRLQSFIAKNQAQDWIIGRGWNQVLWEPKVFPTAADLDSHFAEIPVVLERVDGHATWVNSKVMRNAGIKKTSKSPQGGEIIRDKNGEATGVFIDNAAALVTQKMPALSQHKRAEILYSAMQALNAQGLTGVHDAGISLADYNAYHALGKVNKLPMRIYAMLADSKETRAFIQQPPPTHAFGQRLHLRAIKAWADGALGSRGAALIAPYSDHVGHKGLMLYTKADLGALTKSAIHSGWQVNVHAIGDAGNKLVLDLFEQHSRDGKARALRHRVEHAQVIALHDIPRFAKLDVIASIQPTHATSDRNMAEDRVGSERIKGAYAWRRLLDAHARIASGSDFPVELANPFYGLYAAVTRKDRNGEPLSGWYADQKLTREEALRSFTVDAAYASHMEQDVGGLNAGQWADFIVINKNFFTVDESEIDDIETLATYIAGESVYRRQ